MQVQSNLERYDSSLPARGFRERKEKMTLVSQKTSSQDGSKENSGRSASSVTGESLVQARVSPGSNTGTKAQRQLALRDSPAKTYPLRSQSPCKGARKSSEHVETLARLIEQSPTARKDNSLMSE